MLKSKEKRKLRRNSIDWGKQRMTKIEINKRCGNTKWRNLDSLKAIFFMCNMSVSDWRKWRGVWIQVCQKSSIPLKMHGVI